MAIASQKVEEFSKGGGSSWVSGYQRSDDGLLDDEMDRHNGEGTKQERNQKFQSVGEETLDGPLLCYSYQYQSVHFDHCRTSQVLPSFFSL